MFRHRLFTFAVGVIALNVAISVAVAKHNAKHAAKPAAAPKTPTVTITGRDWTVTGGKYAGTFKADFVSVKNCEVTLAIKKKETVTDYTYKQQKAGVVRNQSGISTLQEGGTVAVPHQHQAVVAETAHIPLKLLSKKDRQFIEKDHAQDCALTKRSTTGDIGLLVTKEGSFYVDKKIDDKTAVISLVVGDETKWTFMLHSDATASLQENSKHSGGGANSIGSGSDKANSDKDKKDKKMDSVDFVIKEKKTYEDNRLPYLTEAQ